MDEPHHHFAEWLRHRRLALHLTQQQLGQLACCSTALIRKIEANERLPSLGVASLLAVALQIPDHDQPAFLRFARGELLDAPLLLPAVAGPEARPLHAPTTVPVPPTALIGRRDELAMVVSLLQQADVRLVTLTGAGGVGKTRLGLAIGAALRDVFIDGIYFVNLAPIADPELVLSAIAATLDVQETAGQRLLASVQAQLRDRRLLLLLDNFEQVLDAGRVVADLLEATRHLTMLITSRASLRVRGEREVLIAPLRVPALHEVSPELLSHYDATRLFIERAQAVKTDFQVTTANAPAVADICVRLDGLPLAIELAAARVKLLSPQALLPRLGQRLGVLTGGPRDLPARQQSLRATIDWSYHLLDANEQTLFARLGVFVGGCTLAAAEAICPADHDLPGAVLDGLQSLIDKSLVQQLEQADGTPRVTMLETIHEYALERLVASGEAKQLRQQHAAYYLALVDPPERTAAGFDTPAWLALLDADQDNLRAVLRWATAHDIPTAVAMAAGLKDFWYIRGYWSEGQRWIEALLPLSQQVDAVLRSRAWDCAGTMAQLLGDPAAALACFEQTLAHAREAGFVPGVAWALRSIGVQVAQQGDHARAFALYEESLTLYRQLGQQSGIGILLQTLGDAWAVQDPARAEAYYRDSLPILRAFGYELLIADTLGNLAELALRRRAIGEARAYAEECLGLARTIDSPEFIVDSLLLLGNCARQERDIARAAGYYRESLERAHAWGDARWMVRALDGVVVLALEGAGSPTALMPAARLGGAVAVLRERLAIPRTAHEQGEQEAVVAAMRANVDEAAFNAAWADGAALSLDEAVAAALVILEDVRLGQQDSTQVARYA